jgi:hypothetical protein
VFLGEIMKAVLIDLFSSDVEEPLADFKPDDPEVFGINFELSIGDGKSGGADNFQVMVCTPMWLYEQHGQLDIFMGRHYLIVFEYNYKRILQWINSYLATCTGETWTEVAEKVARFGYWEFEDIDRNK